MGDDWLSRSTGTATGPGDVGAVIREYRLATGRRQIPTAAELNMTQQQLSQIERGKQAVSVEQRRRFCEVLGIPLDKLGLAAASPRTAVAAEDASDAISKSRGQWRTQRNWLNRHRAELARLAVQLYGTELQVPRTSLIAPSDWIPAVPVDLSEPRLSLDEQPSASAVTGREEVTAPTRPLRSAETRFDSYTSAIKHLDPPALFESRPSYRLLGASLPAGELTFGLAAYFDKLDVSEALGHEIATACMHSGIPGSASALAGSLPFRDLVGDPFAPHRRAIIPAITTLTVRLRRWPAEPSFLLHWRDPARVATAAGIFDVIPAGEFQPSSVALWDRRNDFDLWRNMAREYSEELLGEPEHDGTRTEPIDYDRWLLYQRLTEARRTGTVSASLLGIGVDALTLAATILTVVVIEDDVFQEIFGDAVQYNDEGELVGIGDGRAAEGVPFTAAAVDRMLTDEPLAPPGAACLALAWQHRDTLLG